MPTRSQYDFRYGKPFEANQQVTIPTTQAGAYYVLLYGDKVPSAPESYSVEAAIVPFSVQAVTPGQAGAGPVTLFFKVRLPHALPNIFAGLKMAMASASIGAIVGEFIASQQGLGYLILVANGEMNTPLAFAGMLLLCFTGVALYFLVETAERLATGWHVSRRVGAAT